MAASPNSATIGQSITFTATVMPASGTAVRSGSVAFMNGNTRLGTGTLDATGKATFSTASLAAGTYSLTAVYGGDTNFSGSTSSAVSLTISTSAPPADFALAASASTLTITKGQSGTLTMTVTRLGSHTPWQEVFSNERPVCPHLTVAMGVVRWGRKGEAACALLRADQQDVLVCVQTLCISSRSIRRRSERNMPCY